MSSTDEQMAERRRKNFAVRAEPTREPDFAGEKSIIWTYNGFQNNTMQLAPHEARKLYDLLAAEFGFGDQTEDAVREHLARVFSAMPANEALRGSEIAGQIRAAMGSQAGLAEVSKGIA